MAIPDCTKFLLRLNEQRTTTKFCNAQITSRDGKKFLAHIPVLAAASKHFSREFTSDFKEAIDGKVNLDMDADIVELLLQYMYTYKIELDESIALRLLPEARYLQLSGLKQRCAEILLANVTPSNCIEMWSFARLYSCGEMKDRAWKMVCSYFDSLIDTPEFLDLEKADLRSLLEDKSLVRQEASVFSGVCNWVRADPENRKQHMKELFSLVRLWSLNKEYLVNIVGEEPLVTSDMECVQLYLHCLQSLLLEGLNLTGNRGMKWKASGTWINGPELGVHMRHCSAVVFDGRIYCASEQVAVLSEGSWRVFAPPSQVVYRFGVRGYVWKLCVVDDSMYAVGLVNDNRNVYRFEKNSETWTLVHSALGKKSLFSATTFNNRICVADYSARTIETFDHTLPESGFVRLCSFPADLTGGSFPLCVVDGRLMTVGGWTMGDESTNQVYIFDPQTASWNNGPSIGKCRSSIGATQCGGRLVIAGGFNDGYMVVVQMLVDGEWKPLPSLQYAQTDCGVVVLDNVIYVIGGTFVGKSVEMLRLEETK